MKATFQGVTVAECADTIEVDGIQYFPKSAVQHQYLEPSDMTTFCPDKGRATYFNLKVGSAEALNSVFVYATACDGYEHIRGWYGFWPKPSPAPGELTVSR